jgi:hypothetical protein
MAISKEDTIQAIKISQIIQEYFDKNKNCGSLSTNDMYEFIYKKGISNWDKNSTGKFKDFLKKLSNNNALDLIPQCRAESTGRSVSWYFESTPGKVIKARKLVPLSEAKNIVTN